MGPDNSDLPADFGANDWLIEEMYDQYVKDSSSVDPSWAAFFAKRAAAAQAPSPQAPSQQAPSPRTPPAQAPAPTAAAPVSPPMAAPEQPARRRAEAPSPITNKVATIKAAAEASGKPANPGSGGGLSANLPAASAKRAAHDGPTTTVMRGAPMRTAKNMEASLSVPTATSVRNVPMKLVIDQRQIVNDHLARTTGGKISYTHILGYAMVRALKMVPDMNVAYEVIDNKPNLVRPSAINLGLAIDLQKGDVRQLLVPNIPNAGELDFFEFWQAYEAMVKKARSGQLTVDDFAGTTATLTNPGGLGTNHSVPRLMGG